MRRRALLGAAGAAWLVPLRARSQTPGRLPRLGFIGNNPLPFQQGFVDGLRDQGFVEGKDIVIERRYPGAGLAAALPILARELVALPVDIILAGGTPAVIAARDASSDIPIVMATAGDPIALGLVKSLARPGGRITGMTNQNPDLSGKRLEILREIVPEASRVIALSHPEDPLSGVLLRHDLGAAQALGLAVRVVEVRSDADLETALAALSGREPVLVLPIAFLLGRRSVLARRLLEKRVPAIYGFKEHVEAGGLLSYGPSLYENYYRAASYVAKILRGAKPADLPVEQPTRFELVINMRTARALVLTIPPTLIARADEVIE